MHSVLRSGPGWGFVLEIAFLARPMELSHSLTVICQRQMEGEERQRRGEGGAQSWPLTTHWTFPLSLHPEERFLLTLPPSGTYIQGLVSLLWEISDSTGVLCPCGPCCAPTGLSLCWELGSGSALCWTARNVQSWFSYYYYFMFIECLMAPGWPTASWDRAISPNSTLLRPL